MPNLEAALTQIARDRKKDPLAPVTVVMPTHLAAIHARRRLAELGPYAAVRFETTTRLAELLGAADLARAGRSPLARPIGDYAAAQVARGAGSVMENVRELPGFGRALRQTFRRLRRGGIRRPEDLRVPIDGYLLPEVARLHAEFRAHTAAFYDEEDLMDAAAGALANGRTLAELGAVYVAPPGAQTAGADAFHKALRRAATSFHVLTESTSTAEPRFVLAPDPASEAREAARETVQALEEGFGLHEIALLHGADRGYRSLLAQALAEAGVPVTPMPGTPLSETPAGRGVLSLAELPSLDYARTAVLDFLALAPLRNRLPGEDEEVFPLPAAWRRLAREAGVSHGAERWRDGLGLLIEEMDASLKSETADLSESRRRRYEGDLQLAGGLRSFVGGLIARLEPLRTPQAAASFIGAFKAVVLQYLPENAEAMERVLREIDQLGTVDALGGTFTLEGFATALRANLDIAHLRDTQLGQGVLVADYRQAAGLRFRRVLLCGAYEGAFPSSGETDPLVEDSVWSQLCARHPFIEDAELRLQRSREAARRAIAAAGESLVWTAPLQAANAGREYYPSSLMVESARSKDASLASASELRRAPASAWLRRPASPLAALLQGLPLDLPELRLRHSLLGRAAGYDATQDGHPLQSPLLLLRGRRGTAFGEFDGNLAELAGDPLQPQGTVSPTSLEAYANCGMRYFLGSVLRLRAPEEPEERELMDAAERGSLVHHTLDRFFRAEHARGRPAVNEAWTAADRDLLLALLDEELALARQRGRTGLAVFAQHERRALRADMAAFLDADSEFRRSTGAVPVAFETRIPETEVAGLRLAGVVDRIDRTPDGSTAYVLDYKSGSAYSYEGVGSGDDPLAGGTRLQLPVYLAAVPDAARAEALYWFISRRGEFKRLAYDNTSANHTRFRDTLASIRAGLVAGAFPVNSGEWNEFYNRFDNCVWCDFDRLCSRRRDQEAFDKSGDEAVAPWRRIGEVARGEAQP